MAPGARTGGSRRLELGRHRNIVSFVVRAQVGVRQHNLATKACGGGRKRVGDVAEQHAIAWRYAVVEAVDLAIKDVNLPFRQICA